MLLAAGGLDRARQLLPFWSHQDGIPYAQIAALVRALLVGRPVFDGPTTTTVLLRVLAALDRAFPLIGLTG
jgi:hypothetical protein